MTIAPPEEVTSLVETHKTTLAALIAEADSSEAARLIAKRAAALATWCDSAELLLSQGRKINMPDYLRAIATLTALLSDATKHRQSREVLNWVDESDRQQARAILFQHHRAKLEGKLHLLPDSVLDIVASVQPVPEPTHEATPTKQ